jgi:hypothetical protein
MNIARNVALRPLVSLTDNDGWETSLAQAFGTLFYTGNYFACYSLDGAQTFRRVSPFKLAQSVGHKFCCDQQAHYVPAANLFVWILLADDGPVLMCLASPHDVESSDGRAWTIYVLSGPVFHRARDVAFDYPQVSYGDSFLYLTFNIIGTADAIVCRFAMSELRRRSTLFFQYFVAAGNSYLCPCELSGDRGLFVTQNTTSQLRVFDWRETSNTIQLHDVDIATVPTEDWVMDLPDGAKWLEPASKIDSAVVGVARRRGELWAAWSGARRVFDQRQNSFPHPHIGLAIIRVPAFTLVGQRYLWNSEHAFAYPSLTANPAGEIALTFMWGGDRHFVQHGVGFLTSPEELWSTTGSRGRTGGGHYITARMAFPDIDRFVAAGYNSPADPAKPAGYLNEPRYVAFGR